MSAIINRTCDGCDLAISEQEAFTLIVTYDDNEFDWCVDCSIEKFRVLAACGEGTGTKRVLDLAKQVDILTVQLEAARAELASVRRQPGTELLQEIETLRGLVKRKDEAITALTKTADELSRVNPTAEDLKRQLNAKTAECNSLRAHLASLGEQACDRVAQDEANLEILREKQRSLALGLLAAVKEKKLHKKRAYYVGVLDAHGLPGDEMLRETLDECVYARGLDCACRRCG